MDLTLSETKKRGEMELQHFSHHHPLLFIQHQSVTDEAAQCFGCEELIDGPSYGCNDCKYYLHKRCAELELTPHLNHPFHPQHLLTLFPKSPYEGRWRCDFCRRLPSSGFVYHCDPCKFDLHINCALLQSSIAPNFPTSLHQHPLFFIQDHNDEVNRDCSGCMKPVSGPIYYCLDCYLSDKRCFILHKQCAELPLEINHPYDRRKHPLTLLPKPPTHLHNCSCYLCKIQWEGFVYSCSFCKIELTLDDFFSPQTITNASHEHPWMLLSRQMSFICDFCGTTGDRTPYLCATCNLLVHKNCISLPQNIMITRHHHVISHSYSLTQLDELCRICYEEVDTRYGSYHCSASDCNYIAHVHCATDKAVWDGKSIPEDYDERSMVALDESINWITNVVEQMSFGENTVAVEIKHAYHDHNLRLTFSGEMNDDGQCDGCMRPISTPFYSCEQCKFFLHKECAELSRKKRHPFHKHVLMLKKSKTSVYPCSSCRRLYHGFSYKCDDKGCAFECDIRCILLSDTLEHPSHEHLLFLIRNFSAKCSACRRNGNPWDMAYRCTKRCDFTLDLQCATLPLTTWYKHDRHPLTLTCTDDSDPSQHYCDLCEHERDPNDWFYYCAECDNTLHSKCALGDLPFLKIGSNLQIESNLYTYIFHNHPHPFTIVKNIWDCPPCKVCGEVCNEQALQCKKSECNFSVHWDCRYQLRL
ncbi:hypothetical protein ES288_A03G057100v1 [Gossypium darwinii]|uniref:Phorbol-ester/DAG-type domain-containing protein n=1 Tax=Gossypium darwinii TaxID=34276 RepID=A0A5D2H183_GOSDA|nr:hypothetical protein ES288_A03G057100v1 [Gossypium darwinii]